MIQFHFQNLFDYQNYVLQNKRNKVGLHGIIDRKQNILFGYVPKPCQETRTISINKEGWCRTGYEPPINDLKKHKVIIILGDSTVFGIGATSIKNTIPSKVGLYLNKSNNENTKYYILKYGMLGFNSMQNLITLINLI